jgi:hypothetical protein
MSLPMTLQFPDHHSRRVNVVEPEFRNGTSNTYCIPYSFQIIIPAVLASPCPLHKVISQPNCYRSLRQSNLVRSGLNEIFCKPDYFLKWHFIPTSLLITLFSLFCLCIFKSMSFLSLQYLQRQWLLWQLANSKDITFIGTLIYHMYVTVWKAINSFIQYRCNIVKGLAT